MCLGSFLNYSKANLSFSYLLNLITNPNGALLIGVLISFCLKKNDTNKQDIEAIGDIVISKDTILKELKDNEKTFKQHISHIAIHGLLHLLGYVHDNDKEAKIMENIEIKILNKLNIPNPYVGVI